MMQDHKIKQIANLFLAEVRNEARNYRKEPLSQLRKLTLQRGRE